MSYKALSPAQVEQFIECGYVPLRQAFACQDALAVQDAIWERLAERGIHRSDPATWTEPVVHIKENYSGPVFEACMTPRFADAIEDLVGPGRWRYRGVPYGWGWWPVNFSRGADQPWTVPTKGWHWDGGHFRHTLNSPEQGVLALCIFSEIGSRGGATLFAEGSHHLVARFLSQQTEGLELTEAVRLCSQSHPWLAALTEAQSGFGLAEAGQTGPTETEVAEERISHFMNTTFEDDCGTRLRVVEGIASPGDVFLCHPFLYHSASQNHLRAPRFLCNRTAPLREPMCFERPDGDYSPVEISIRQALSQGA